MGGEKWLAVLLEVCLICRNHAIEPWEKLLGAVIGVKHDWNTVDRSNRADVVSSGNGTVDAGVLAFIGDTFSSKVCSATLGGLEDDRTLLVAGSFKGSYDSRGGGDVDGGNGILVLLSVLEELQDIVTGDTVCWKSQ